VSITEVLGREISYLRLPSVIRTASSRAKTRSSPNLPVTQRAIDAGILLRDTAAR
jgi:hypothetical protein